MIDLDRLHDSAARLTGLDDFGDDSYVEGLRILSSAYDFEAGLTPLGEKVKRSFLRGALCARLFSEAAFKSHPSYAGTPIERPVFVTGLPRTGTTALHRMLTTDPGHQGLELWLADVPQPRPPRETWSDNMIFQTLSLGYEASRNQLSGVHHVGAAEVEECWYLLRQSMLSVSFECLAHIPTYSAWLAGQDWTGAYRRHRRNLQLIGLNDPGRRWVLKNPSHLFALEALLAAYPDALIVQTHRPVHEAIASVCSLNARATQGWSTAFTPEVIGRTQLELWARGLEEFSAARARHDPGQFIDVNYDELVEQPRSVLKAIYGRLGGDPPALRARLPRPEHSYALEDFGLTREQVERRFARIGL